MAIHIIHATPDDVANITQIQAACYSADFIEDAQAFAAKIKASPHTCWLAKDGQHSIGYLVSVPVSLNSLPRLNSPLFQQASNVDALYLHDLAIHPDFRASGAGLQLVQQFKQQAANLGFKKMLLIAVQDSTAYWQRHDFQPLQLLPDAVIEKVTSFGLDAQLMQCHSE